MRGPQKGHDWRTVIAEYRDALLAGTISQGEIARRFGVHKTTVQRAIARWIHRVEPPTLRSSHIPQLTDPAPPPSLPPATPSMPLPSCEPVQVSAPTAELQRVLFVPDAHIPYHDHTAWHVMVAAARIFRPHVLVVLGDLLDFYMVSRHSKDPRRVMRLEDELLAAKDALDALDALGAQRKVFIAGNHEHRLEEYLRTRAPELFGVVSCPELLGLERRGWEYHAYRQHTHVGHMLVTHDLQQTGVTAIRHARTHAGCAVAIGHTHRMGMHYLSDVDRPALPSVGFGWLGSHELADYRTRWLAEREWIHGFGVAWMQHDGTVWPQAIPIRNGSACLGGQMVMAS